VEGWGGFGRGGGKTDCACALFGGGKGVRGEGGRDVGGLLLVGGGGGVKKNFLI